MKITYIGPFVDGVELEDGQWAEHGEPVEVDTELGERLLEQVDNFASADAVAASVDQILADVGADTALAASALAAEQAQSRPRKTLISALEAIVAAGQTGDQSNG